MWIKVFPDDKNGNRYSVMEEIKPRDLSGHGGEQGGTGVFSLPF